MNKTKGTTMDLQIGDKVWIYQNDIGGSVLGKVVGFTPKRIKCENLTRDYHNNETNIGSFLPKNVKKLTEKEINERKGK